MTDILYLFLQTKNIKLSTDWYNDKNNSNEYNKLFILRSLNSDITQDNIIHYTDPFFEFNTILNKLSKYTYVIYTNDCTDINLLKSDVDTSLNILNNSDLHQVIYGKCKTNHEIKMISDVEVQCCMFNERDLDDMHTKFNKMKQIFVAKANPYKNPETGKVLHVNHVEYAQRNIKNTPNFRLEPSIIKVNSMMLDKYKLISNNHFTYKYSLELESTGFKSCYLNKDVSVNTNNCTNYDNTTGNNFTIVTGFLTLPIKRPPKRSTQKYNYLEKALPTLQIDQHMVLYLSKDCVGFVIKARTDAGLMDKTKIVEINIKDNLYLFDKLNQVRNNVIKNIAPYNIGEYVLSVNSRYNYIQDAIDNNYFNTDYFGWVDFSAGHIVDIPKEFKFKYSKDQAVKIAWIARFKHGNFNYNHTALGGGIFFGHKTIMSELSTLHDIEFRALMDKGYCINDDRLLFTMFEKYPYLFDTYFAGYSSLITKAN